LLRKVGRLFTIKTRFEAWLVIYAIALGAVERGRHYLEIYPGFMGWTLALACTGVVFLAGGKLLDAVRPSPSPAAVPAARFTQSIKRRRPTGRNRPTLRRYHPYSESRFSRHTD
jgi:hypothetical protein